MYRLGEVSMRGLAQSMLRNASFSRSLSFNTVLLFLSLSNSRTSLIWRSYQDTHRPSEQCQLNQQGTLLAYWNNASESDHVLILSHSKFPAGWQVYNVYRQRKFPGVFEADVPWISLPKRCYLLLQTDFCFADTTAATDYIALSVINRLWNVMDQNKTRSSLFCIIFWN